MNYFLEYLKNKNIGFSDSTAENQIGILSNYRSDARGKLFEYIVFQWLNADKKIDECFVGRRIQKEQIDCLAFNRKIAYLFECKNAIHKDTDKLRKRIAEKERVVKNQYPDFKIWPILIVYSTMNIKDKTVFEENGIRVIDNFREKIMVEDIFSCDRDLLLHLLDDFSNSSILEN